EVPTYGEGFKRPSAKKIEEERERRGPKSFEANEIRAMLDKAGQPLKAMILLGINGALGNHDVTQLPISALNLKTGWMNYSRRKTGVRRKIPLWVETCKALDDWLQARPEPVKEEYKDLVFLTAKGKSWTNNDNPLSRSMAGLMKECGLDGHRGYYGFRHSFQTQAEECGDLVATKRIMGHKIPGDISETYRDKISDARLMRVTEFV